VLPTDPKSSIESEDPSSAIPKMESELPSRLKLRIEILLPIETKSSALSEDPRRVMP
jgi:hypothetical protein